MSKLDEISAARNAETVDGESACAEKPRQEFTPEEITDLVDDSPEDTTEILEPEGAGALPIVAPERQAVRGVPDVAVREALAQWLILPKGERAPATQKEFAAVHGFAESTISRIRHDDAFYAQYVKRLKQHAGYLAADAIDAIGKEAAKGSLPHAETLLEVGGVISPEGEGAEVNLTLQQVLALTPAPDALPDWTEVEDESEEVG